MAASHSSSEQVSTFAAPPLRVDLRDLDSHGEFYSRAIMQAIEKEYKAEPPNRLYPVEHVRRKLIDYHFDAEMLIYPVFKSRQEICIAYLPNTWDRARERRNPVSGQSLPYWIDKKPYKTYFLLIKDRQAYVAKLHERPFSEAEIEGLKLLGIYKDNFILESPDNSQKYCLIQSYLPDLDLFDVLTQWSNGLRNRGLIIRMFLDIANQVKLLHANGLVHRDIKVENIIFEGITYRARLTDAGLLARKGNPLPPMGSHMSPELEEAAQKKQHICPTEAMDVYALGTTFISELLFPLRYSLNDRSFVQDVGDNIIVPMRRTKPENRCSLDACIENLHKLAERYPVPEVSCTIDIQSYFLAQDKHKFLHDLAASAALVHITDNTRSHTLHQHHEFQRALSAFCVRVGNYSSPAEEKAQSPISNEERRALDHVGLSFSYLKHLFEIADVHALYALLPRCNEVQLDQLLELENEKGQSVLHLFLLANHVAAIRNFLAAGKEKIILKRSWHKPDRKGYTPLMLVERDQSLRFLELLLPILPEKDVQYVIGRVLVHAVGSVLNYHAISQIEQLFTWEEAKKISIPWSEICNARGESILMMAAQTGQFRVMCLLLMKEPNPEKRNSAIKAIVKYCIETKDFNLSQLLLNSEDIDLRVALPELRQNPYIFFNFLRDKEVLQKFLLKFPELLDRPIPEEKGTTLLHYLIEFSSLVESGNSYQMIVDQEKAGKLTAINWNVVDGTGKTLLQCAAERRAFGTLKLLLMREKDPNKEKDAIKRYVDAAIEKRDFTAIDIIVQDREIAPRLIAILDVLAIAEIYPGIKKQLLKYRGAGEQKSTTPLQKEEEKTAKTSSGVLSEDASFLENPRMAPLVPTSQPSTSNQPSSEATNQFSFFGHPVTVSIRPLQPSAHADHLVNVELAVNRIQSDNSDTLKK